MTLIQVKTDAEEDDLILAVKYLNKFKTKQEAIHFIFKMYAGQMQ